MNKRIAKKAMRCDAYGVLWKRARQYEQHRRATLWWQTLRLVNRVELVRDPAKVMVTTWRAPIEVLVDGWQDLRPWVVRKVPKRDREGDTEAWGLKVFGDVTAGSRGHPVPLSTHNLLEAALGDLSYYSDRWCRWRLFYMDALVAELATRDGGTGADTYVFRLPLVTGLLIEGLFPDSLRTAYTGYTDVSMRRYRLAETIEEKALPKLTRQALARLTEMSMAQGPELPVLVLPGGVAL